uniref:PH domain-containing protein n=1 Tax=Peromyscus maniculatus bairdii TaxID=230844 RepID=A0A8C8UJK6_PERMB
RRTPSRAPSSEQGEGKDRAPLTESASGGGGGGDDVVCTGWLRKSPPEKKLRRYAWKKRWFILRSGRMSGDPGVLEYYKNEHSKKPLRIINLNLCEQVDTGLTFNKKKLQDSFVFDIKTSECTFYLVAETEADMNKWVQSICQICGFTQAGESTDSLRNLSSASHGSHSSPAEVSGSTQHLLRERKSSAPSHSGHRRTENARSASFSQGTRQKSDTAMQKLAQGNGHWVNGVSGQVHGFYSLPKPSRHNTEFKDSTYDLPRSLASQGHTKGSLTGSETDTEDTYEYPTRGGESASWSAESPGKTIVGRSDSASSDDNYVPMNPGSSTLLAMERAGDNSQSVYIPMSPGPHHFDPLGYPSTALPIHRGPSRGSENQPPPVNRNLKPDRKAKPTPLDLRNNTVIDELPFTKSWSRLNHTANSSSSQYCRHQHRLGRQRGELRPSSPVPSGTNSPAPKKSTGSVDYLALDFQPGSPSPHRKPSTSSVTSDEKVDYIQVDKEKTQALQNTMQEWTDMRQSSEPSKGAKL